MRRIRRFEVSRPRGPLFADGGPSTAWRSFISARLATAMDTFVWSLLGYVVYPAWLLVGVLDYAMHQRTHIATTSGVPESALHVAQAAQIGLPVLIVLFFAID